MKLKTTKFLRTSDIANDLGVHVNSIRLYEASGFLSPIPRRGNGYRQYSAIHLEQARLTHLTISWPYLGEKAQLVSLVRSAASGDLGMAMELAYQYLAHIRMERTFTEAAIEFLERWAAGYLVDNTQERVHISEAAKRLTVTVDMLRNWERNGLITVPREPNSQYRLYGASEFGRIRVIRTLLQAGYSLMAILRMLQAFDAGKTENLANALELPLEDSANEQIEVIADHWLSSLLELENRTQAIIKQISRLMELSR